MRRRQEYFRKPSFKKVNACSPCREKASKIPNAFVHFVFVGRDKKAASYAVSSKC